MLQVTMYDTGSMQYVAINLITGGASLISAALMTQNVNLFAGTHGIPEILAFAAVVGLHVWKRNTLLSIAVGTVFYMFLVQAVF